MGVSRNLSHNTEASSAVGGRGGERKIEKAEGGACQKEAGAPVRASLRPFPHDRVTVGPISCG